MAHTILAYSTMESVIGLETINGLRNSNLNNISGLDGYQIEFLIRKGFPFRISTDKEENYENQRYISENAVNYLKMNLTREQFDLIYSTRENPRVNLELEKLFFSIRKKYDIKEKNYSTRIIHSKIENPPQMVYTTFFGTDGKIEIRISATRQLFRQSGKK
jgi:ribosomal protein L9